MIATALMFFLLQSPLRILMFDHNTYCNGFQTDLLRILQGHAAEAGTKGNRKNIHCGCVHGFC